MDTKEFVDQVLDVIGDLLALAGNGGLTWRLVKKTIRRRVWRPYLKPALGDLDYAWVPDVLLILTLVRLLVRRFWAAPQSLRTSAMSPAVLLKKLAE